MSEERNERPINKLVAHKTSLINELDKVFRDHTIPFSLKYNPIYTINDDKPSIEKVIATCNNGYEYTIDVTADSDLAMIKDVVSFLLNHS